MFYITKIEEVIMRSARLCLFLALSLSPIGLVGCSQDDAATTVPQEELQSKSTKEISDIPSETPDSVAVAEAFSKLQRFCKDGDVEGFFNNLADMELMRVSMKRSSDEQVKEDWLRIGLETKIMPALANAQIESVIEAPVPAHEAEQLAKNLSGPVGQVMFANVKSVEGNYMVMFRKTNEEWKVVTIRSSGSGQINN